MPTRRKTSETRSHSPMTPEGLAAREQVAALIATALALTGRSKDEFAAAAGVNKATLESWIRQNHQHYRNPTTPQLARVLAANGCDLLLDVRLSNQDGGGPAPYADALLRCGTKDKGGPVETLWLDGSLAGSVYPAEFAREVVSRWYAARPAAAGSGDD